MSAALEIDKAQLELGGRVVWSGLDLAVARGEFVAVLGANGAGKSSLLRVLLGLLPVADGRVQVLGRPPRRGRSEVGYLPQHRTFVVDAPLRGRDLVRFGLDGHRYGLRRDPSAEAEVDALLASVGASSYADKRVAQLSGGEQQRLRIAQALAAKPEVMLCDEPLQSLDIGYQRTVVQLVDRYRQESDAAVLFVTHDVNPVAEVVDHVLYLHDGRYRWGPIADVMTSESLSELYRSDVEVIRHGGRLVVVGAHGPEGHSV